MTTTTVVLQIVDKYGTCAWWSYGTYGKRLEEIRSHPAATFDDAQPAVIPITLRHGGSHLGAVGYLEHGVSSSDLTAVAVLDDTEPEQVAGLYCSAEITAAVPRGGMIAERCRLDGLALVGRTAGVAARPVVAIRGDYRYSRNMGSRAPTIVQRAAEAHRIETRSDTMRIHRPIRADERLAADLVPLPTVADLSRRLEMRSAPTIGVVENRRLVEVLVAPVDTLATVFIGGRTVTESYGLNAFAGDEHRASRVKVNREHNPDRLVGKCVAIDPYASAGCIATMRIAKTLLGDETLALAEDRVLDASAGFRVPERGERWNPTRTHRTITAAQLDHVALVGSPAYETAAIIDVRRLND